MIKYALLLLFFGWLLWLQPTLIEGNTVSLKLLPTLKPTELELDTVVFLVALIGLGVATAIALLDRFGLAQTNRKLKKELQLLRQERDSLRSIVTTDKEHG